MKDKLPKTKAFLSRYGFKEVPFDQDNLLVRCEFCGKKAWREEDIEHRDDCELGEVLEELQEIGDSR